MTHDELIALAEAVLRPRMLGGRLSGDVGAALLTPAGEVYTGVCIDTASGTGFCAEHSAIAAMVTAGGQQIASIVAVWKDANGNAIVLPPCGRCREFMRQIDDRNLDAEVILGPTTAIKLESELLPYHEWPAAPP